jgi:hypothetical protein
VIFHLTLQRGDRSIGPQKVIGGVFLRKNRQP